MDDDAFIRAILAAPADDLPRLVYADWLDDHGDATAATKSEFLRLTAAGRADVGDRQKRLRQLAAKLDADWLAAVSRLPLENCSAKRAEPPARRELPLRFDFLCDRRWEDLTPTADRAIRRCDSCRESVHYCNTIDDARRHARAGECVAVSLGVIRRSGDLQPGPMRLGKVTPAWSRRRTGAEGSGG
jgi:uncharacterized protein (TIGR02996 family)